MEPGITGAGKARNWRKDLELKIERGPTNVNAL
jgi:hypothetical protein